MKKSLLCSLVAASLLGVGCSSDYLDPVRDTSVLTTQDFAEFSDINPALVQGTLDGIYSYMIRDQAVVSGAHNDLGQKGVDIWMDIICGDMALSGSAYGWYDNTANLLSTVDFTRYENRVVWTYYYKIINLSNNIISSYGGNDAVPGTAEARHILGQAKALRGYAYFYLAQLFQREYNPTQAILPYYDGQTSTLAKVPASQIYSRITSDLTSAISLLNDYTRDAKHKVDKNVAKGLLAYTYAAMGDYAQVKTVTSDLITSSGYPLTSASQLVFTGATTSAGAGFNDINTPSWMWGYDITLDMGVDLLSWWGQVDVFTYSYAWAGDKKSIDNALYAQIPANDRRKAQFLTNATYYLQPGNKFFAPARALGGQRNVTTDYLFMRIDEMYLLNAEASAKTGDEAGAKSRLVELLTTRLGGAANANTYVNGLSGQSLVNAIYLQTRIELWGEGKSYLAMKRNQATVTRGTNHVFRAGQSFSYNSDELSFQIPQVELNNNAAITEQN
ncbi:hypothetical protein VF12_38535 [Nostoc linckia z15]|nr:hypothetical protein VF12_38535 [Nostoc linckia z15]